MLTRSSLWVSLGPELFSQGHRSFRSTALASDLTYLNHLVQGLISKDSHALRCRGLGFQHGNSGDTAQPVTSLQQALRWTRGHRHLTPRPRWQPGHAGPQSAGHAVTHLAGKSTGVRRGQPAWGGTVERRELQTVRFSKASSSTPKCRRHLRHLPQSTPRFSQMWNKWQDSVGGFLSGVAGQEGGRVGGSPAGARTLLQVELSRRDRGTSYARVCTRVCARARLCG